MKKLRIILAEDHALVRAGIRLLLERIPGVKVVGDTGSGKDAIELIRTTSPDIALLDLAMPELNWLRVAEVVSRDFPSVKVIILSVHGAVKFVRQALRAAPVAISSRTPHRANSRTRSARWQTAGRI